jgi:beta-glucanase (GH16 family)
MDWTPGSSTWFVNGQLASRITFQAPRDPALVIFNTWSDGGSWSGNMSVGGEAYMQIRWIDIVYNSTDPGAGRQGGCRNVCSIDETTKIGTPVLLTGGGCTRTVPGSALLYVLSVLTVYPLFVL